MSGVIGSFVGGMIALLAGAALGWSVGFDDGWDGALDSAKKMMEGVDDNEMLTFAALRALLDVVKKIDGCRYCYFVAGHTENDYCSSGRRKDGGNG